MTIADTFRHLGLSAPDPRSDGELLTRFVAVREEPAFAELLRRHGPTVYGVCRRVLANAPDADDAFQAVFLVLARKADSIRPPGMVGNWLYGVAVRTANKARVMNAKRTARQSTPLSPRAVRETAPGGCGVHSADTLAVIDAELAALPEVYRAAFVTCELNGRSRSEASRELGWPEGTVAARLAKARELLAARLTKRGVTLGVGLFAAAVVPTATAAETMSAVRELLAVGTATAVAPAAQTLSDEVAKTMTTNYAKWLLLAGLVLTLAGGGAVLLAAPGDQPTRELIKAPVPKEQPMEWKEGKPIEFDSHPHGDRITGVASSSDGKFIAVAVGDQVRLLDAGTRKQVNEHSLTAHAPATITAVAFCPKGDRLAVTARDYVFIYSDLGKSPSASSDTSWKLEGFDPHQLAWLSGEEGKEQLVASNGRVTKQYLGKGKDVGFDEVGEHPHKPRVLAPVPGKVAWLMDCSSVKQVPEHSFWYWEPSLPEQCHLLTGHKARPIAAVVAADGKRIVSVDEKGTLIVWEGDKFKEQRRTELGEGVQQLAVAADGKSVAAVRAFTDTTLLGTSGRTLFNLELFVFDVTDPPAKQKPLWSVRNQLSDAKTFTGPVSLAFAPDGKTLLAAFADPYIDVKAAEDEGKVVKAEKSMGVKVWELVPKK